MSNSESRAETVAPVVDDREEVVVTRTGHEPAVAVPFDDYQSLHETAYLLRSPENARRLLTSIERLEAGDGTRQVTEPARDIQRDTCPASTDRCIPWSDS